MSASICPHSFSSTAEGPQQGKKALEETEREIVNVFHKQWSRKIAVPVRWETVWFDAILIIVIPKIEKSKWQ